MTVRLKNQRHQFNGSTEFLVRVVFSDGPDLQGRIEHLPSGQAQQFRSYLEMVTLIRQKLEEGDRPQEEGVLRSWMQKGLG